jgi:putative transposase
MNHCPYVPVDKEKAIGVDLGLKDFAIFRMEQKSTPQSISESTKRS